MPVQWSDSVKCLVSETTGFGILLLISFVALDDYLTSLNLSFFICKSGIIIPTLWGRCSLDCLAQCQVCSRSSNNSSYILVTIIRTSLLKSCLFE